MSFEDFFEDHGNAILITVGVILFIGLVGFVSYYGWVEEDTAETIVMCTMGANLTHVWSAESTKRRTIARQSRRGNDSKGNQIRGCS